MFSFCSGIVYSPFECWGQLKSGKLLSCKVSMKSSLHQHATVPRFDGGSCSSIFTHKKDVFFFLCPVIKLELLGIGRDFVPYQ